MDLLQGLNKNQREAVTSLDGRIRVVAGAGSGKTKALTHRYAYLVETVGIDPANILCLTFTNKAASEMKSRISKMVNVGHFNDFVSTIHGFCVKVLRKDIYRIGYPKWFTILDEEDMALLAKEVLQETGQDRTTITVKQFLSNIQKAKGWANYVPLLAQTEYDNNQNNVDNDFLLFLKKQQRAFALDFQDLIYFVLYLFETFPEVREYWQNQFDYIMVDETQDCNKNDWAIINILTEKNNNLFVVGDPDQAIYEWRGAAPSFFVHFQADKTIILNENYRSTQNILNVANSIIKYNIDRVEKDLYTNKTTTSNIIHFHGKSEKEEAKWITSKIETLYKEGKDYSDIAILYRASYQSRFIEEGLLHKKIPYVIYGGIRFFERKEIKDALSYLRLINSEDDLSFLRVLNTPSRKLGDAYKKKLTKVAEEEGITLYQAMKKHIQEKDFSKPTAIEFVNVIEEIKQQSEFLSISDLLQKTLRDTGYETSLREDGEEERLENIKELSQSIIAYEKENVENDISLATYLQDIALYTNLDMKDSGKGFLKLMTIHQSKGLEFPYVFIIGLNEGIIPNHKAIRDRKRNGLEEERRLMYVAVTRAVEMLYLTESEGYSYVTGNKCPSRFLCEIEKNFYLTEGSVSDDMWRMTESFVKQLDKEIEISPLDVFKVGAKVRHEHFGEGEIIMKHEEGNSYKVKFREKTRNIRAEFLELAE